MATSQTRTADDIADSIRSLVDRLVDTRVSQQMTRRGQEVAAVLGERSAEVGELAGEAWRDSAPMRRDAAKRLAVARRDAARWSDRTWRRTVRPHMKDLWNQRTVAVGAAGAAVPVGRELVDTAAVRLGIRQRREERHWAAFFLGLVLGGIAGAVAALLTAPKRGEEMRQELSARADELATRARDEWVPLFQGGSSTNGHTTSAPQPADGGAVAGSAAAGTADALGAGADQFGGTADPFADPGTLSFAEDSTGTLAEGSTASLADGATEAGSASGEAADQAADDAAEAIAESFDSPERQSTT